MLQTYKLQQEFKSSVLKREMSPLEPYLTETSDIPAEVRLGVYENNVYATLIDALAKTFPTVENLVGSAYFKNLARVFIRSHPPESGCLHEYGALFPFFCKHFTALKKYPYIPDVAMLDWAKHQVYYEVDAPALSKQEFAALAKNDSDNLSISLSPALRLIESEFPIEEIWQLAYEQRQDPVDMNSKGAYVLVCRPHLEVNIYWLNAPTYNVINLLMDEKRLSEVLEKLSRTYSADDLQRALAFVIEKELIVKIEKEVNND